MEQISQMTETGPAAPEQKLCEDGPWHWVPASQPLDPVKWAMPSPDPADDPTLRAYEEAAGAELRVRVTAEAVQRAAFEPDFGADDPWAGVQAEPAMHTYEGGI